MSSDALHRCIHVVDDDAIVLDSLMLLLRVMGEKAVAYPSGKMFLETAKIAVPDIALFDLQMPDLDGFALFGRFRAHHPDTPVILMTGHGNAKVEQDAMALGFRHVLHKPFSETELKQALDA
jgi:FixJ family two-component response regulator